VLPIATTTARGPSTYGFMVPRNLSLISASSGVAGAVFNGSTQVAKIINRALAAKDGAIVPLIAETGGINAMLVDSTALPEQVVDAVVQSAFRSAARELVVGDPALLSADVGPVIDQEAFDGIHPPHQTSEFRGKTAARPGTLWRRRPVWYWAQGWRPALPVPFLR
jgi:delta 1-pyrroline-5-carboxylate dehydrogenase